MRLQNWIMMVALATGSGIAAAAVGSEATAAARPVAALATARETLPFDLDWRFYKGDAAGAEQPRFDDAGWRALRVPHDWSIEGPFSADNATGKGGGYLPAGVGWYRKQFTLPEAASERRVFMDFDGVMANSDVWLNDFRLGHRPYGYVSFRYELTGHLHFGAHPNVIAVRCDNSAQPASRWYAGAGIYRHVRLVLSNPVHIDHWGVFITTPRVTTEMATVHVRTTVVNQSGAPRSITLETPLFPPAPEAAPGSPASHPSGPAVTPATVVPAGGSVTLEQDIAVPSPLLWDLAHPQLYRAISRVYSNGKLLDEDVTPFGIRDAHFEPATGLWLNGKNLKLKGVCLHHDAGGLGAAVPLSAWERRLALLKQLGCNAIRTSHNPPNPEFLDLCDRMGFLVMDEMFDCWTVGKNPYDYHLYFNQWSQTDLRDTVRRDRNHPSVVLYSAGNEIHDTPNAPLAKGILAGLRDAFHQEDPTRPVTMALFRPNVSQDYEDGLADLLDVVGTNYREKMLVDARLAHPGWKVIGTEDSKTRAVWLALRDNPTLAGVFLWTGFDYLGESTWPDVVDGAGLFDHTNLLRPIGMEFQSYWCDAPIVHIVRSDAVRAAGTRRGAPVMANWTLEPMNNPGARPAEGGDSSKDGGNQNDGDADAGMQNVQVYSNCQVVELFLNGKSLGTQPRPADDGPRTWKTPFEPGTIRALGSNDGKVAAADELRTAGKPARLLLSVDRTTLTPAWDDVAYLTTTVVDANGVPAPWANDTATYTLAGPGSIVAVDSGDPASHEPFQGSQRRAFHGRCIAIVRATAATGPITVTASAPGLLSSSITIGTTPPPP